MKKIPFDIYIDDVLISAEMHVINGEIVDVLPQDVWGHIDVRGMLYKKLEDYLDNERVEGA